MQLRYIQNFKYIRNRRIVLHQFSKHGELKLNILVIGSRMGIFQIFMRPNKVNRTLTKTLSRCLRKQREFSDSSASLQIVLDVL